MSSFGFHLAPWHQLLGTQIGRFGAPTREFLDAETLSAGDHPTACQKPSGMLPDPVSMVPRPRGGPVAWPCAHVRARKQLIVSLSSAVIV